MKKNLGITLILFSIAAMCAGIILSNDILVNFITDNFSSDGVLYHRTAMQIRSVPIMLIIDGFAFLILGISIVQKTRGKSGKIFNMVEPKGILILALFVMTLHFAFYYGWSSDDQYISYRYAKNLADGNGLVFNIGEQVEGYSNFLFVVSLAIFRLMGIDVIFISKLVGMLFGYATLVLMWRISESSEERFYMLFLLALSGPMAFYAVSGMETVMFAFFIMLSVYMYSKERFRTMSGIIMGLTALTRTEGFVVPVTLFIYSLLKNRKKAISKKELAPFLIFLLVYTPYLLWKLSYYGEFLSSPYYAKAAENRIGLLLSGGLYLTKYIFLGTGGLLILLLLFHKNWDEKYKLFLFVTLVYMAFIVYVGGDQLALLRFFVHIQPLIFLLVSWQLPKVFRNFNHMTVVAVFLLMIMPSIVYSVYETDHVMSRVRVGQYIEQFMEVGVWMRYNLPYGTILFDDVGAIPYYSDFVIYDTVGLVSKDLALVKIQENDTYLAEYALSKEPDYILIYVEPDFDDTVSKVLRSLNKEIYKNEGFQNDYSLVREFVVAMDFAALGEESVLQIYRKN